MASCHQATSHNLNQCCSSSMIIYGGIRPQWVSIFRPRQDGCHFADDIFTCIFFNENCCNLIKFSLKYVRKGPIDNYPALVQIMAWRHYLNQWWLVYWRIYASLVLNELMQYLYWLNSKLTLCSHYYSDAFRQKSLTLWGLVTHMLCLI